MLVFSENSAHVLNKWSQTLDSYIILTAKAIIFSTMTDNIGKFCFRYFLAGFLFPLFTLYIVLFNRLLRPDFVAVFYQLVFFAYHCCVIYYVCNKYNKLVLLFKVVKIISNGKGFWWRLKKIQSKMSKKISSGK